MGRTERITITAVAIGIGVAVLALLWALWTLVSDVRDTVSSVNSVVREIAQVQGVQEGVLNRLDALPSLGSDGETPVDAGSADPGSMMPGRPSVSARQLWDDFDANQVRAAETYSEPSVWAVSGTVDSIQFGENHIFVGLDGLVRVGFAKSDDAVWLNKTDKGQHLWFECEVTPVYSITRTYDGEDPYFNEAGYMFCISPHD